MDYFRIADNPGTISPCDLGARCLTATTCEDPRVASLPHGEEPGDGQDIRLVVDTIPTLAWSARPDGSAEFFNQRWLDYTGLSAKQALGWGWEVAIHPDDLPRILETFRDALNSVKPYEVEGRFRRFDGEFRWFLFRASPLCDESGKVVKWYGTNTDIEDRKRAEDALRSHEQNLRLLVDTIPGHIVTTTPTGEIEQLNRRVLEYFDKTPEELVNWRTSDAIHPDDLALTIAAWTRAIQTGEPYEHEHRLRRADGAYRWFHTRGLALRDKEGRIVRWYLLPIDVDDRRRAEEALRKSEERWRSVFENSAIGVALTDLNGRFLATNHVFQAMVGYTEEELRAVSFADLTHEDYRQANWALVTELVEGKRRQFQIEKKYRRKDGSSIWVSNNVSLVPGTERVPRFIMALSEDITQRKRAEEALRSHEQNLRLLVDTIPGFVVTTTPAGEIELLNRQILEYLDKTPEEVANWRTSDAVHPDDLPLTVAALTRAIQTGEPYEVEHRLRRADGAYRWFHTRGLALRDKEGRIVRWYYLPIDVDDRRRAEEALRKSEALLHNENVVLREQIDQAFMFEEIVGTSSALQEVLSRIVKVAPTDSSVLVSGESGTGKELVARAIHKRSRRSQRAFVSVNCAALAPSLIASELFGHEKGAFTGAMQRRLGRFELANGGTIFLDEIGEVPLDTQVALLRVLQEREFERVGGTQPVKIDVRIIAATNRDLEAAVANGTFRADLYYRLNVFPIQVPALRERQDDVLMLLEYFVQRFAQKMGKNFKKIDKRTVELFRSYPWPGNIRELQNVVERSVIVSSGGVFSVDAAWLSKDSRRVSLPQQPEFAVADEDARRERQIIEDALAGSRGRVSGPDGAAARLRVSPSTLEYHIKKLRIRKSHFKLS
jgi:PAS domain S-box-containing protein